MSAFGPEPLPITRREAKLLEFFGAHVKAHGFAPSFDEMAAHMRLKSKSGITRLIDRLEDKGLIRRLPRRARGLELVHTEHQYAADCGCASCADRRYLDALKLVQAVKNDAPAELRRKIILSHVGAKTNLVPLTPGKRATLLGVSILSTKSTGSAAAPRTRARAIPKEAL